MPDDVLEIKNCRVAKNRLSALLNTYSSNPATGTVGGNSNTASNSGYIVDINGEIEFPILGKIKAGGLTKEQFKEQLKERCRKIFKRIH